VTVPVIARSGRPVTLSAATTAPSRLAPIAIRAWSRSVSPHAASMKPGVNAPRNPDAEIGEPSAPSPGRYAQLVAASSTSTMYGACASASSNPRPGWNAGVRFVYISACSVDGDALMVARGERYRIRTSTWSAPGASP